MPPIAESLDDSVAVLPAVLLQGAPACIDVAVHDASRLGLQVIVPLPEAGQLRYSFELELELPTNLVGAVDPWAALQSYARLDGTDDPGIARETSLEAFRRSVVSVSSKLARARDGFLRHCRLIRSSTVNEHHWRPLTLWLAAASTELANARSSLLRSAPRDDERALADEFLSTQLWTVLTDCGRALFDTRRALEDRDDASVESFEPTETALAAALTEEMAYRHQARFVLAEPVSTTQLERLLARMRWLKRHFERVLFLDVESYEVLSRLSGWFSALAAMLAYLWFLLWQLTLERHPVAIGSGVVAFALITAVVYASRERLKEIGRAWLAGRVQRIFAQRVTRYRLSSKERSRGGTPIVVSARESFSQSSAQRSFSTEPESIVTHDVTLLRLVHRGLLTRPSIVEGGSARVRLIYRLDLSGIFPRLHDAVRGFAWVDKGTGQISIVDVPRNYELPLRASLRWDGGNQEDTGQAVVLNKNGLLRVESQRP